ncbi:MAG: M28 family peptidase [Oscillospiraceae bacterium]|jgi:hypothetical protein|nr:M28 family peptidase [Oscillospiraceae bacterium]
MRQKFFTKKRVTSLCLLAVTLAAGVVLGLLQVMPQAAFTPSDEEYPAYERMLGNVRDFSSAPHPMGTEENIAVRDMILEEITEMGLTPAVSSYTLSYEDIMRLQLSVYKQTEEQWWSENGAWVEDYYNIHSADEWWQYLYQYEGGAVALSNILVKLDSPSSDSSVMFVSHYDSVADGYGAGDDMVAVCAMLEGLRSQANNANLSNDLYFLFTDGEEDVMLGAQCFAKDNPEFISELDMIVNLDARGNSGGLLLYETSPKAGSFVDFAVRSDAPVIPFSLAFAIYEQMDNWTDFTVFLQNGGKGINLAVIGGYEYYHTHEDTFENLNKDTACDYLKAVLALSSRAAEESLLPLSNSDAAVSFPFLPVGAVVISYPAAVVISALGVALFALWLELCVWRKKVSIPAAAVLGVVSLLTIASAIFFMAENYLFSIPLVMFSLSFLLKKIKPAYVAALMVSGVVSLLLWTPVVYLLWEAMVVPMLG